MTMHNLRRHALYSHTYTVHIHIALQIVCGECFAHMQKKNKKIKKEIWPLERSSSRARIYKQA